MPYIQRDANGAIIALVNATGETSDEYLPATAPEVVAFLSATSEAELSINALAESDRDIARVTEDLISLLISKNIILFTELPDVVQQKLLGREKLRSTLSGSMENFLDDNELL